MATLTATEITASLSTAAARLQDESQNLHSSLPHLASFMKRLGGGVELAVLLGVERITPAQFYRCMLFALQQDAGSESRLDVFERFPEAVKRAFPQDQVFAAVVIRFFQPRQP